METDTKTLQSRTQYVKTLIYRKQTIRKINGYLTLYHRKHGMNGKTIKKHNIKQIFKTESKKPRNLHYIVNRRILVSKARAKIKHQKQTCSRFSTRTRDRLQNRFSYVYTNCLHR